MSVYVLQLPRRSTSVPEARAFVRSALGEADLPDNRAGDLLVAVSEACSNVVSHATGSDTLRVEVRESDEVVRVVVSDQGTGFDPDDDPAMPDPDESGGRGLALMDLLCDSVDIDSSKAGTQIELLMARSSMATD